MMITSSITWGRHGHAHRCTPHPTRGTTGIQLHATGILCRACTSTITALGHAHGHESPDLLLGSMRRLLLLRRRCLPRRLWHVDGRCVGRAALAVRVEQQHLHQEEVHPLLPYVRLSWQGAAALTACCSAHSLPTLLPCTM